MTIAHFDRSRTPQQEAVHLIKTQRGNHAAQLFVMSRLSEARSGAEEHYLRSVLNHLYELKRLDK